MTDPGFLQQTSGVQSEYSFPLPAPAAGFSSLLGEGKEGNSLHSLESQCAGIIALLFLSYFCLINYFLIF